MDRKPRPAYYTLKSIFENEKTPTYTNMLKPSEPKEQNLLAMDDQQLKPDL
jgi:hypothetical protein